MPRGELPVPAPVETIAAGEPLAVVWENELGGLTFEVGTGRNRRFVKWAPAGCRIDLDREAERLEWASSFICVPRLLDAGESTAGSWIVTSPVPGSSAVAERWRSEPRSAVRAIGKGLRELHDRLPVDRCPFSWDAEGRLSDAQRRASAGLVDPSRWHPVHRPLGLDGALAVLSDDPPVDRNVVCHGDSCAPNTLLDDDGRCSGHVDLGWLGVADRWADLAVATWSTKWNYGPRWERPLLDAYGVEVDEERIRYYRLLWDLGP